jgi:phage gpG-like protein
MAEPAPIGVQILLSDVSQQIAEGLRSVTRWLPQALEGAIGVWQLEVDAEVVKGFDKGDPLKRRTGQMARSLAWTSIRREGGGFSFVLKSPLKYPAIHEFGGVIRPVTKQWLTIPLKDAMTPAGVTRKAAPEWPDSFIARSRRTGKLILFQRKGEDKVIPLFVLVRQVEIPARHWLSGAIDATSETLGEAITRYIEESMKSGGKVRG